MSSPTTSGSAGLDGPSHDVGRRRRVSPHRPAWGTLLFAAVVYVPLMLTRPGKVGADTKTYLYLDPGRLLSRAANMWDPNIGMGTVTHQNIGYLWPLGPYYWLMDAVGIPDWAAQRIWLGSILFMAGLGVRWMLRQLRWEGAGATVAMFAYALSPYVLEYAARISVILLPFAGLPWLIGLAARSLRRQDWASPALFALVTLTVGGVNATSLILVMFGPLAWFAYATFIEHDSTLREAISAGLRITVLTAVTSIWWIVGLLLQGAYGIPILRYTETYQTVAAAALAPEILRGLGYWFFYGTDGLGAWTASTVRYVQSTPAIALSYLLPGLGLLAGLLTRWRHRVYFALLIVVGTVISVGAHPWDNPSPYGAAFKAWTGTDFGLSFRSTPRAAPLVILGLAVFLGSGVAALARSRPRVALPAAASLIVLICINQLPLFLGQMVDRNLIRDEQLPRYWLDAAAMISEGDPETRVYELPGVDFAAYRWGNTVDPITPGLTDREYVARELIPYGSPQSAALLNAIEAPFQSGNPEPAAWAPIARMMGVGQVIFRADTQFERYRTPRPRRTFEQLMAAAGLSPVRSFGDPVLNDPDKGLRLDDEVELATPSTGGNPPPVMVFDVDDPRPILRTVDASAPQVVAGDANAMVTMATLGALAVDRPLFFSASFAGDRSSLEGLIANPASTLVVTDTNRRRATRWASVRDNDGATERAGEKPLLDDPTDSRLEVFPAAGDDQRTVVDQRGGATVASSRFGNNVTYTAGDRAVNAVDGNPSTGWHVGAFDDPTGEFIEITSDEPITTDRVVLLQNLGPQNRFVSDVSLSFDGKAAVEAELDQSSRAEPGQTVVFPERTFRKLRVTIDRTDPPDAITFRGMSDVGFAEISVPGVGPIDEVVRPPLDLLDVAGADSLEHELFYMFTRRSGNGTEPDRRPEEPTLRRWLDSPVDRLATAFGRARLSRWMPDEQVDAMIGRPDADHGGITATSSVRLAGDLRSRASSAVDANPNTAYQSAIGETRGVWVELTYPEPITLDRVDLDVMNDGKHSIPRRVALDVDGHRSDTVDLPALRVPVEPSLGSRNRLSTSITPVTGKTFRFTIDDVDEVRSQEWFSSASVVLPVGIAEIGVPQLAGPGPEDQMPAECREDLVGIDGTPVPLRLSGTVGDALAGTGLDLVACGDPTRISVGRSLLQSSAGTDTGINVDMLALSSAAGGGPGPDTLIDPVDPGPTPPTTTTERTGRNQHRVTVSDASDPYWVVLGQSWSPGFKAVTGDGEDLGESTVINGYANGWLIDPAVHGHDVTVDISWTPQRLVWFGLAISAVGVLICLALISYPAIRARRGARQPGGTGGEITPAVPVLVSPWLVDGAPLGWSTSLGLAGASGAVAGVFAAPVLGAVTAAAVLIASRLPRGQVVLRVTAVASFGAAVAYILVKQWLNDYVVDFNWVSRFEATHGWALLAVFALAMATIVDALRSQSNDRSDESP